MQIQNQLIEYQHTIIGDTNFKHLKNYFYIGNIASTHRAYCVRRMIIDFVREKKTIERLYVKRKT